jgi:hypothetical protein
MKKVDRAGCGEKKYDEPDLWKQCRGVNRNGQVCPGYVKVFPGKDRCPVRKEDIVSEMRAGGGRTVTEDLPLPYMIGTGVIGLVIGYISGKTSK